MDVLMHRLMGNPLALPHQPFIMSVSKHTTVLEDGCETQVVLLPGIQFSKNDMVFGYVVGDVLEHPKTKVVYTVIGILLHPATAGTVFWEKQPDSDPGVQATYYFLLLLHLYKLIKLSLLLL